MFNINLHIDDLDTLKVIAKNLGIGSVTIPDAAHLNKNVGSYRINKQSELFKLNSSELISINYVPPKGNTKPLVFIGIENIRILYNYLLPFLKGLPFLTKNSRNMLLSVYPVTIPLSDGRLLNPTTQKLDSAIKGVSVFEIVTRDSGEVNLANSLEECASIIGISRYVY